MSVHDEKGTDLVGDLLWTTVLKIRRVNTNFESSRVRCSFLLSGEKQLRLQAQSLLSARFYPDNDNSVVWKTQQGWSHLKTQQGWSHLDSCSVTPHFFFFFFFFSDLEIMRNTLSSLQLNQVTTLITEQAQASSREGLGTHPGFLAWEQIQFV